MASADLRDELNCSICLSLYTDPVFLRCGHNFCSLCIVSVLDTQEAAGAYFCPDCRAEYPERPALEKNRKLGNIVECFLSTLPDIEKTKTVCPDCTKTPVSAMKSHLQCEISLCHEHLEAHNKLVDESLVEPTESFESRKCSKHNEVLKYYCPIDAACICESCCVDGDHKGHDVDRLDVASEKKKEKLRSDIDKLNSKKEEAGKRIQNLQDHGKEQQEKAAGLAKRVSGLFIDLREKMDNLEKRIQDDISKQKYQVSLTVLTSVLQMQQHKDELTKIVSQLEGMCNISDPFTLLQEDLYSDDISDKSCDVISDVRDAQCLDEVIISHTLQKGLLNFSDYMINLKKREFTVTDNSDRLLDIDSAHNNIMISQNLRSASYTATLQNRPDGPKNLKPVQVLSSQWAESTARQCGVPFTTVTQNPGESMADGRLRNRSSDLEYDGIPVVEAFMEGLRPEIRKKLKDCTPYWRHWNLTDLMQMAIGLQTDLRTSKKGVMQQKTMVNKDIGTRPKQQGSLAPQGKINKICYYCRKSGHVRRNCSSHKAARESRQIQMQGKTQGNNNSYSGQSPNCPNNQ
ncbi:E3 ubiquitin/ISG15 ligase TRIM25-like [Leptodactylus fuscus]|uniref:E3 ubiquitin/ISG15 ligase TRIM25-like n=1 Tax=Leptodactylus fuscus TaxID=238119 RepID=UPI003F4E7C57